MLSVSVARSGFADALRRRRFRLALVALVGVPLVVVVVVVVVVVEVLGSEVAFGTERLARGLDFLVYVEAARRLGSGQDPFSATLLAFSLVLKLLTAPLIGYLALRRRWPELAVALLLAVATPEWLPTYVTRVLPRLSGGSGFIMNLAPAGTLVRLTDPKSLLVGVTTLGPVRPVPAAAHYLTSALGVILVALTAWRLGWRAPASSAGIRQEVAAVVALSLRSSPPSPGFTTPCS